ncbi:MAG: sigma-70 family RNA polymerase sigma factor [Planctomycetes bacterium]|nr:sigma-70 family RNA polymerase sigma factor [Planctomycetota bacterium]MBI3845566.1 sigma-70 family RNA polymerase sigma factor [Planctomycetota bacterium]
MATFSDEHLLSHGAFVRRLVRSLLADEASVDDVVQDSLLAAIEHGPRDARSLRAWLATVARNAARKLTSRERGRPRREERGAKREAVPSAASIVATLDEQRRLVEAVRALAEPCRTAVMLRFFDDLPPREIARRLDIPVETVKSQIKRGLADLRARLDHEHGGDRSAWCLALAPLAGLKPARHTTTAASGGLLAGAVAMTLKMKLGIAVAIAVVVCAAWLLVPVAPRDHHDSTPPPSNGTGEVSRATKDAVAAPVDTTPPPVSRPSDHVASPTAPEEIHGATLLVAVRTRSGDLVDGVRVVVTRSSTIDVDGRQVVVETDVGREDCRSSTPATFVGLPLGRYTAKLMTPGIAVTKAEALIDAPHQRVETEIVIDAPARIVGRCENPYGAPIANARMRWSRRKDAKSGGTVMDSVEQATSGEDGRFELGVPGDADWNYSLLAWHDDYGGGVRLPVAVVAGQTTDVGSVRFENSKVVVSGVITDASGSPLANVTITPLCWQTDGALSETECDSAVRTSADGRFRFVRLTTGTFALRAENFCLGEPAPSFTIRDGDTAIDLGTLVASEGPFVFRGVSLDDNDQPLAGAKVVFGRLRATSDDSGRFEFHACKPDPGRLQASWKATQRGADYVSTSIDDVRPGGDEIRLSLRHRGIWFRFEDETNGAPVFVKHVAINGYGVREGRPQSLYYDSTDKPTNLASAFFADPGRWIFLISVPGYEPLQISEDVPVGFEQVEHRIAAKLRRLP